MFNLFGKKKKEFRANCELSKEPLEKGRGYVITTAQLISSRKFWDNKMTEPETMSYTVSHFKSGDKTSTHMREMIFNKYSNNDKPWLISESYGHLFDINENEARDFAQQWWDQEGNFVPDGADQSLTELGDGAFQEIKMYAVMEAGKSRVA
ncbi:MAG: hypothetical protein AAGA85_05070 [Bacteroidota bacterium]